MADSLISSAAITNLDLPSPVMATAGEGARGYLYEIDGYVSALAADSSSSLYRIVRVPTTAKVKGVIADIADLGSSSTGAVNVGVYYSDSENDGTPLALQGAVVDADFFAAALDVHTGATKALNVTNQSGTYGISKRNQPLWQAVGLSADPGGFFDITVAPSTAGDTAGDVGLTVTFVS